MYDTYPRILIKIGVIT